MDLPNNMRPFDPHHYGFQLCPEELSYSVQTAKAPANDKTLTPTILRAGFSSLAANKLPSYCQSLGKIC